jgi:hypothetical protein
MVSLNGKLKFKCVENNHEDIIEVVAEDFNFENTWTDEDRGMGSEEGFEATVETLCPNCDKEYQVNYMYTEYPVGAPNCEEFSIRSKNGEEANVEILENSLTIF